jgi:hypothetical protein
MRPSPSPWSAGCLLTALLVGAGALAQPETRSLTAGPLTIRHEPPFERVARELARRAPAELARIERALGLSGPPRAEVHLLPRKGAADPRLHGLPVGPEWSAGLTLGSRPVIVLRTAEDLAPDGGTRVTQVFAHELVHLVAIHGVGDRHAALPAWLKEGTASHLAFEWRLADSGRALRFAIGRSFVPLARLRHGFHGDAQQVADAYFESRAFVGWLLDEHGPEAFRELWGRLAEGEDFDAAFLFTYGAPVRDLEEGWRRHFLRRYAWVPLITSATTPWIVVALLVVLGGIRKRRRGRSRLAAWEEEERLLADSESTAAGP